MRRHLAPGAIVVALLASAIASPAYASGPSDHDQKDQTRQVQVISENDMYGGNTDRYYTSGQRIVIDLKDDEATWLNKGFDALGFENPDRRTASLGQTIYTPDDITRDDHPAGSHPWAGWLGLSAAAVKDRGNGAVDSVEVSFGTTGPSSLAERSQKFVHETFGYNYPAGWDKQLKDEPTFNVTYARHWPELGKWDIGSDYRLSASPYLTGALGTWDRSVAAGGVLSFGTVDDNRVTRPAQAMPGRSPVGLEKRSKEKVGWNLYMGGEARYVGWHTPIDGNTWKDSPSAERKDTVGEVYAGAELRYKNTSLRGEIVKRTEEFEAQDGNHAFGRISFTYRF